MPQIELQTSIRAPRERVFALARNIDAHQASAAGTNERAIAGVTTGLVGLGQRVTWEARHFGLRQRLTVEIVGYDRPARFRDTMRSGAFAAMTHEHLFEEAGGGTIMRDKFEFRAPLGPLGWMAERLFITRYMTRFLRRRATALRLMAESDTWQKFLA